MTGMLYRWPAAAAVGSRIPKEKFYEHAKVTTAVREKFVAEVQRITWAYKLAEVTINLPGTDSLSEIQVFQIELKGEHLADSVLWTIDKSIPHPIIFEITRDGAPEEGSDTLMIAAPKLLGSGTPRLGPYLTTNWQPAGAERAALPPAINLTGLYLALLQPLTPLALHGGGSVSDLIGRMTSVQTLEREISALERKLRREPQLNRKVELRRIIKAKQAMLVDLTSTTSGSLSGSAK